MNFTHLRNALFILVTVTEMSVPVALVNLSWPRAMWKVSSEKRRKRDRGLLPKSSASANSAIRVRARASEVAQQDL